MESFYIFILREFFTNIFGIHYPTDIVVLIMMALPAKFKISCGFDYSTLISDRNELYVWGSNENGILGLGDKIRPTQVDLGGKTKLIACGCDFMVALVSVLSENSQLRDKLYVWGANSYGELGLGDYVSHLRPTELDVLFDSEIKSINCSIVHTIVLLESGTCYGWGCNGKNELGLDGPYTINTPQKIDTLP